ncbi:MAG: type II toxin-antitoxin system VapC family toxin [Bryobacteraceae bacterium]
MKLLLDTNVFLWAFNRPNKLSVKARQAMSDRSNELVVSCISIWEIVNKVAAGKLQTSARPEDFNRYCDDLGIARILSVEASHVYQLRALPSAHADPFDRMLVAQAQVEGLRFVSSDSVIAEHYLPDVIW